jgi:hypothetical protein
MAASGRDSTMWKLFRSELLALPLIRKRCGVAIRVT